MSSLRRIGRTPHGTGSRTKKTLTAGAAALVLALTGCSASNAPTTSESAASSAPVTARTLRIWAGSTTPITTDFNPFHVDTALYGTYGQIYEPLFFFNQLSDAAPTPMLGESYEYSADGKTVTLTLTSDVKWSDGQPLTAKDVVFTLGYGPNKTDKLVKAEATSDTTVVLSYSTPQFTSASQLLGATMIVPQHIWSTIDTYMKATDDDPVGSGACVVKTTSDAAYTLTANPNSRDGAPPITDVQ